MNGIIKKQKKVNLVILIVVVSIVILGTIVYIIGSVDFIRAMNGKKPMFTYHAVDVSNHDVSVAGFEDTVLLNKKGAIYYGLGYSISICDFKTGNYVFQLGHRQKEPCFSSLTCTEIDDLNINRSFEYSFFDGKLYRISKTHLIPIENTDESEEEFAKGVMKLNDVKGCGSTFKKINETTYEIVEMCNLVNMSDGDIYEIYQTSHASLEQTRTTREEIIDYYHNWMICK